MTKPVLTSCWLTGFLLFFLALSGCSGGSDQELDAWMLEQKNSLRPKSEPVSVPKKFDPQPYEAVGRLDPFAPKKLTVGSPSESGSPVAGSALLEPELNRRKEPLELYPLDVMTFVGSLHKSGKKAALLRVDKLLYQVFPGNYIGQNYGKIVSVTDAELVLREIVQDSAGEWVERQTTLQLQEAKQ
jgi:type IV pilus assembly protein PilP